MGSFALLGIIFVLKGKQGCDEQKFEQGCIYVFRCDDVTRRYRRIPKSRKKCRPEWSKLAGLSPGLGCGGTGKDEGRVK